MSEELSKNERRERRIEELLGDGYLRLKDFGKALEHFKRAETKEKLTELGKECLKDFKERPDNDTAVIAVDAFEKAGVEFPGNLEILPGDLGNLGSALQDKERFRDAFKCFKKTGDTEGITALAMKCLTLDHWRVNYYMLALEAFDLVGLVNCRVQLLARVDELLKIPNEEEAKQVCEIITDLEFKEKEKA